VAELEKMMLDANAVNLISLNKNGTRPTAIKMSARSTFSKTKRERIPRGEFKRTT